MAYTKKPEGGEMEKKSSIAERYFEKPTRLKTWSGIPVKETYTPDDVKDLVYARDVGNPGEYPYTRGIFKDMYRGRMWSIREISGYDSPKATNEKLKRLMGEGESALNVICDAPTYCAIDADHPRAEGMAGLMGVPLCSMRDAEVMMEDIPIDQVSVTLSVYTPAIVWFYFGAAEKQGVALSNVRGTILADTIDQGPVRYFAPAFPEDLGCRVVADILIWCNKNAPRFYPLSVGSNAWRESGATAAQEIAFDFCTARRYLKEVVARGGNVDEIAQRIAFTHRVGIDIFEEAAKFRAARRVWARMLREEFGATNPRALSFKVHAVTKGTDYTRQQPENNIVRVAYQALAAVLGGVQSMHTMSYDEPICLPTEESHRIAIRTQQILAYETGVVNVADPLGGSYYVESLTNRLAEEISQIMEEHKETIVEEIYSERLMHSMQRQAYEFQQEVESGTRKVIGVNCFQISKEEERKTELHKPSWDVIEKYVDDVKALKRTRNNHQVKESVENLRKAAERKEENLVPAAMDAARSYASLGEIWGAIRLGYGYSYDPFEEIEYPF